MNDHNSARDHDPVASCTVTCRPGDWVLIDHWRGPISCVERVTAKTVVLSAGRCEPSDVRAVFANEAEAEDGLRRYLSAWLSAQFELKTFEEAKRKADTQLSVAKVRLRQWAFSQASAVSESTDGPESPGLTKKQDPQ